MITTECGGMVVGIFEHQCPKKRWFVGKKVYDVTRGASGVGFYFWDSHLKKKKHPITFV